MRPRLWTDKEDRQMQEWRDEGVPLTEIAERLGRTHKAVQKRCYRDFVPLCKERGRKLTEKEIQWLIRHYKNTRNCDIQERFGISYSELHRLARKHGLKKTRQFMKKTQAIATQAAYGSHIENGTFPPKGYQIPNCELHRFQKGVTNVQRLGKKREAERAAKAAESWRRTRKAEYHRFVFGLEQQTKFRFVKQSRHKLAYRYGLRKVGYVEDPEDHNLYYYTSDDMRRPVRERGAPQYGIRFKPYQDNIFN